MNVDFLECPACGGYGVRDDGSNCRECGGSDNEIGSGDVMVDQDTGRRVTHAELIDLAKGRERGS